MKRIPFAAAAIAAALTFSFASPASAEVDKKTERLWKAKCSSCHGMDGKGETDKGKKMKTASLADPAYQKKATDDQIKKAILEGVQVEKDGVKKEMDPYKDELKAGELEALVAYIRALK